MESNLSSGIESKKASVYGRDYAKDLDAYNNDLNLQRLMSLFGHYDYIQNAKHLADIAGITELEAMDALECLKNLSLLGVNEKGYFTKTNRIDQELSTDVKARSNQHSIRLMQMASLYTEAEKFTDDYVTAATTKELIVDFYNKIAEAKKELIEKTDELNSSEKTHRLTFALGFLFDDISTIKGSES